MASALVASGTGTRRTRAQQRARDWAEIQERMLVPLYEAVYQRLEVGPATSVLGLGCRSGLALLLAAARGAEVVGLEPEAELRSLAQDRSLRVLGDVYRELAPAPDAGGHAPAHSLVTAFEHLSCTADPQALVRDAARLTVPGGSVALATWGPPERCQSAAVLSVARRLADPLRRDPYAPFALSGPGAVERLVERAGLRLGGGGRVCCPFAYPDLDSAVRGLLSTGVFDAATGYSGEQQVRKEVVEALHPYLRRDGSVRMENVFRYTLAERIR
ncbi:methyltransferase domain-containing protein [Streptacidiphilus sp. PB12-B1b]|uniref:class I SAM-dependent methyltransferase n=1 Tax=Streptacidiphilus sp. PB12-B1b TaxID=2705012 RepID=UPI0015FD9E53|nr:methyltransferase domain-containing protein [Streptacidiphilus sp. PB12-B1b]QMU78919.1 methyltransferase domain-containing protein [Streptacidiphilus sp. PB12-B1b]